MINKILKFADDTKIVRKEGSEVKVLQTDLKRCFYGVKIQDWQMLLICIVLE